MELTSKKHPAQDIKLEKKKNRRKPQNKQMVTVGGVSIGIVGFLVIVVMILFAIYWYNGQAFTLYSGFWMNGLTTVPYSGCTGSPASCNVDGNMASYAPFYYTAMAVGNIDPALANGGSWGSSGSQKGLTVGKSGTIYAITPLDQQGDSSYYQWQLRNSYWDSVKATFRISDPNYFLYNVGLGMYMVPVVGDFPQGSISGWNPSASYPPDWIAHTFTTTPSSYDYVKYFPHRWHYGTNLVVPPKINYEGGGLDPDNGSAVSMPSLAVDMWLPTTPGAKSGAGTWYRYYLTRNSTIPELAGPVDFTLSTTTQGYISRFNAGLYWTKNGPTNWGGTMTSLAGGSVGTPNSSCNNGTMSSTKGAGCTCSGKAFGWNCAFPSPSTKSPSSFSPQHSYSSSSSSS